MEEQKFEILNPICLYLNFCLALSPPHPTQNKQKETSKQTKTQQNKQKQNKEQKKKKTHRQRKKTNKHKKQKDKNMDNSLHVTQRPILLINIHESRLYWYLI